MLQIGGQWCPAFGGVQPWPVSAGAFPRPWERGQLGVTIPMGFKRLRVAVGTQNRLFPATMRVLILLAALVAVATSTETFVG